MRRADRFLEEAKGRPAPVARELPVDLLTAVLGGGVVDPGSGRLGYYGVQLASNTDPFYYRPDVDAPRYPGLLAAAVQSNVPDPSL